MKSTSLRKILGNQSGNLLFTVGVVSLITLGTYSAWQATISGAFKKSSVSRAKSAEINNKMVISKLGYAVSQNFFLCSESTWDKSAGTAKLEASCKDNKRSNFDAEKFGFTNIRVSGNKLKMDVESCLSREDVIDGFSECVTAVAEVEISMVNLDDLIASGIISGNFAEGDLDKYGIYFRVITPYKENNTQNKEFVSKVVVRRPRAFVRLETGAAVCKPTCQLSESKRENNFCFGKVKIRNEQEHSDIKSYVFNDGPGHINRFVIKRNFVPDPEFADTEKTYDDIVIYDSLSDKSIPDGVGPGDSVEFGDSTLPCFDEKIFTYSKTNNVVSSSERHVFANVGNHRFDGGRLWAIHRTILAERDVITNTPIAATRASGVATYYFDSVEPNNALKMGKAGSAVPATATNIHTETIYDVHEHRVILHNTGMN